MQYIFGGSFAVDIIDRITGDAWLGYEGFAAGNNAGSWVNTMIRDTIIVHPMLWFFLNILWLGMFCYALNRLMNWLAINQLDAKTVRIAVRRKVNVKKLEEFISRKKILTWDNVEGDGNLISKASWQESGREYWCGLPPTVIATYDKQDSWLLYIFISWSGLHCRLSQEDISQKACELLQR